MSSDKFEDLRKRVSDRLSSASQRVNQNLSGRGPGQVPTSQPQVQPPQPDFSGQAGLQAGSAMLFETMAAASQAAAPNYVGEDDNTKPERPPAPKGKWRCIVESPVVTIDLMADVSEDGSLSARGTLIYVVTNKIFEVDGKGTWVAMPPDKHSSKWLFNFMIEPSTHPIFRWFASPTDSPNHLKNRFVSRETGNVVETRCERVGGE